MNEGLIKFEIVDITNFLKIHLYHTSKVKRLSIVL